MLVSSVSAIAWAHRNIHERTHVVSFQVVAVLPALVFSILGLLIS